MVLANCVHIIIYFECQQLAFESVKLEYTNAQLECNAADERAKLLASEVISLEEKALRLRSNELKLEKQMENLNSEITSFKRKVSVLEKERQDLQSTVDALQEEDELVQKYWYQKLKLDTVKLYNWLLAVEKEELVQALRIESLNCSKLKVMMISYDKQKIWCFVTTNAVSFSVRCLTEVV
ncbi:hypothetical protein GW17_00054370 [Ensete ventricosum]|nr:hypothetical protein GW17_00054370 [Ensete ventricosum]